MGSKRERLIEHGTTTNGGIIGLSLALKRLPALRGSSIAFMWLPIPIYFVGLVRAHMVA
jgi:hypothetical protein